MSGRASLNSWDVLWDRLNDLIKTDPKIAAATAENAKDFLSFAQGKLKCPEEIGRGYNPTIRLSWSEPPLEIEVYSGGYEFYRFFDGRTDIRDFPRNPKQPIPTELTSLLSELGAIQS
jgi:hypothetical protein